ncbi:uncharacterized protein LOC123306274 [Coccinella septempunctata]|uniref:uncharacterized protein LOC123306274 n=1 Tax=Coccinella septempunctata TaxID=41139 RepID=UPI001D06F4E4|nr:uncharacterized protein LOC123306274 [Coccinella septempunctata]
MYLLSSRFSDALYISHEIVLWVQRSELSELQDLQIPCHPSQSSQVKCEHQQQGFGDPSEKGYAAVVVAYFRFFDYAGNVLTSLVYAESKFAPVERISHPGLKLCEIEF